MKKLLNDKLFSETLIVSSTNMSRHGVLQAINPNFLSLRERLKLLAPAK